MSQNISINSIPTASLSSRNKIHPQKFMLWMGIGSICMMFAGLTSAYIVKRNQGNWLEFDIPVYFWYSTLVIMLSSITIQFAVKAFKERAMQKYKALVTITAILGIVFSYLQWIGFSFLNNHGIQLIGRGSNPAASFLFVIMLLHIVHVIGGVMALLIIFFKAFSSKIKTYSSISIELAATYWHFVDLLWIYLFIFFYLIK